MERLTSNLKFVSTGLAVGTSSAMAVAVRQSEECHQRSASRLAVFSECAEEWFWETGVDLTFRYASASLWQDFGVAPRPDLGLLREHLRTGEKSPDKQWTKQERLLKQRSAFTDFELKWVRPDGSLRSFLISGKPVFDNRGVFQGFRGVGVDVTRRRKAQDRLHVYDAHFRELLENTSDMIMTADVGDARIARCNSALAATLGYGTDEIVGKSVFAFCPSHLKQETDALWRQFVATGKKRVEELQLQRKDGTLVDVTLSISAIRNPGGEIVQALGVIRDVSEKRRLEERVRKQQLQLRQTDKMRSLGTLVSGVAHEINNPNGLVRMSGSMLLKFWTDTLPILDKAYADQPSLTLAELPYSDVRNEIPNLLQDVQEGSRRIGTIVGRLRDFTRPREQALRQPLDLNGVVAQVLALLGHLIWQKTKHCETDLEHSLPPLMGDAQQLEQVLVNLVVNALEALPNKDCGIKISTAFEPGKHCLELRVEDQGCGIASSHLAQLTEPFFTTKQDIGGTGLGLSISHGIIDEHGGTIEFESTDGKGTLAMVSLPLPATEPRSVSQRVA